MAKLIQIMIRKTEVRDNFLSFSARSLSFSGCSLNFTSSSLRLLGCSLRFSSRSLSFLSCSLRFPCSSLNFLYPSLRFLCSSLRLSACSLRLLKTTDSCQQINITGIKTINTQHSIFQIYPNPASSSFQVSLAGNIAIKEITLVDVLGNEVSLPWEG